jgi:hypothetical protein
VRFVQLATYCFLHLFLLFCCCVQFFQSVIQNLKFCKKKFDVKTCKASNAYVFELKEVRIRLLYLPGIAKFVGKFPVCVSKSSIFYFEIVTTIAVVRVYCSIMTRVDAQVRTCRIRRPLCLLHTKSHNNVASITFILKLPRRMFRSITTTDLILETFCVSISHFFEL